MKLTKKNAAIGPGTLRSTSRLDAVDGSLWQFKELWNVTVVIQ
jgi:hypothetical protein